MIIVYIPLCQDYIPQVKGVFGPSPCQVFAGPDPCLLHLAGSSCRVVVPKEERFFQTPACQQDCNSSRETWWRVTFSSGKTAGRILGSRVSDKEKKDQVPQRGICISRGSLLIPQSSVSRWVMFWQEEMGLKVKQPECAKTAGVTN